MTKIQADRQIENMVVGPVAGISLLPTTGNRNTRYLVGDSSPYKEYIWDGISYLQIGDETIISLKSDITNSTITMTDIPGLTMTLGVGWYRVTFVPFYNVNATTTGTGWNFGSGTAVISNYSFRSELPSTATANYVNNYASRSQNYTTAQTSRLTDNRGTIKAEFQVTTGGTLIPRFRSEVAGGLVTLRAGSYIKYIKTL